MAPANLRELSERELHELVAEAEGHDSQVKVETAETSHGHP